MSYLLDTHALLWFITDNSFLPKILKEEIKNIDNKCVVSIASFWEIGIKHSLHKLILKNKLESLFNIIESNPFEILPVLPTHILKLSTLKFNGHRDPFDRMLIAQAQIENPVILTKDKQFSSYDVPVKWN